MAMRKMKRIRMNKRTASWFECSCDSERTMGIMRGQRSKGVGADGETSKKLCNGYGIFHWLPKHM